MNIACLGYGVVGKGVAEILMKDSRFNIKKILVKELSECPLPQATADINDIFNDDEIDTVVEMMGGIDFAYFCISEALKRGKNVVTSNKAVVAAYYSEFLELAKKHHVKFRMEAAVAGGIPWIHTLLQQIRFGEIDQIEGIFNGTTNYIFDQMHSRHEKYDVILKEAQKLGYAEQDPSSDVDGTDILRKLMISSSIAFKTITDMNRFSVFSMRTIQLEDILYFEKNSYRCRYYAFAIKEGSRYCGTIEPSLFEINTQQSCIHQNNNLTSVHHDTLGELQLIGQGAGRYPTANAVVQDIFDILEDKESIIIYDRKLDYDESLIRNRLCVCGNEEAVDCFKEYLVEKEKGESRWYGWTEELTYKEKNEAIKQAKEKDETFFYAAVK